jgi:hypothetical protein
MKPIVGNWYWQQRPEGRVRVRVTKICDFCRMLGRGVTVEYEGRPYVCKPESLEAIDGGDIPQHV